MASLMVLTSVQDALQLLLRQDTIIPVLYLTMPLSSAGVEIIMVSLVLTVQLYGDSSGEMASLTGINLGTGRTATAIATGQNHTCALLDNASVKCWGYNAQGQLGIDSTTTTGYSSGEMASLSAVNLGTGRTATAIAAGHLHTCALLDNASVKCWGYNNYGQLGIDSTTTTG